MKFNSKEKGGNKSFSLKTKHQNYVSNEKKVFVVSNHQKNGDCYDNPSLSNFRDKLWF